MNRASSSGVETSSFPAGSESLIAEPSHAPAVGLIAVFAGTKLLIHLLLAGVTGTSVTNLIFWIADVIWTGALSQIWEHQKHWN